MALLGAHMSVAGGLSLAFDRGEALGCESMQIFVHSSRTWKRTPVAPDVISAFKKARTAATGIKSVVAHNSYLLNLSTADGALRKKSVEYFIGLYEDCEALGIDGVITHPGSHLGAGVEEGIRQTASSLKEVLRACPKFRCQLLLENTAGQGGCIGHEFEHLRDIVDKAAAVGKIGFCFDTQHAFAAGYDLRTESAYEETFSKWEKLIGTDEIRAFHLNDALKELGCRVDRHANIGQGFLGKKAFAPLVNDPRFEKIPMCLETNPGEKDELHKADLAILRKLRKKR